MKVTIKAVFDGVLSFELLDGVEVAVGVTLALAAREKYIFGDEELLTT